MRNQTGEVGKQACKIIPTPCPPEGTPLCEFRRGRKVAKPADWSLWLGGQEIEQWFSNLATHKNDLGHVLKKYRCQGPTLGILIQ